MQVCAMLEKIMVNQSNQKASFYHSTKLNRVSLKEKHCQSMPERKLSNWCGLCSSQVCTFIQFCSAVTFTGSGRIKETGGSKERRCWGHFNFLETHSIALSLNLLLYANTQSIMLKSNAPSAQLQRCYVAKHNKTELQLLFVIHQTHWHLSF